MEGPDPEGESRSHLTLPLRGGTGEVRGVFVVSRSAAARWSGHTRSLIEIFAARAGGELERRRAEDRARTAQEQFEATQRLESVGRLAGGIAHDFNNLLTVILGYAELLRSRIAHDSPLQRAVGQLRRAGDRAAGLTRQLLAFSRRQVLELTVLDLSAIVAGLHSMLRRLVREDIQLDLVLDDQLGGVRADPSQMGQVVLNLVINAVQAMPTGGTLTIETTSAELGEEYARTRPGVLPGSYVMLAVSDTGAGMDAKTVERVFEPFFTTRPTGEGTGLGLATVHGIVKQSGGDVWVSSELGVGTTFKIYLPRTDAAVVEAPPESEQEPTSGGTETVLVVEDDEAVREYVEHCLTAQGYTVLVASSPDEALTLYEAHHEEIALLLSDVVMPKMSGPALAAVLRKRAPHLRIVFMSGYADVAVEKHGALEAGAKLLQKPFTGDVLGRMMRKALDEEPNAS